MITVILGEGGSGGALALSAGVLALGFHSVGMLAKLFSEAIENLDADQMNINNQP